MSLQLPGWFYKLCPDSCHVRLEWIHQWSRRFPAFPANNGLRAFDNSPDAGMQPIVNLVYLIRRLPAWNTVSSRESSSSSNWWKAERKSNFDRILYGDSCALISSGRIIGMLVGIIPLFGSLISTVTRVLPSSFGERTRFESHGHGPVCSSIMPSLSIISSSRSHFFLKWKGIGLAGWHTVFSFYRQLTIRQLRSGFGSKIRQLLGNKIQFCRSGFGLEIRQPN